MNKSSIISISLDGLTEGEACGLEMMQIKSQLRELGIRNIWTFFKLDYPKFNVDLFRAKINARTTDRDFVEKLRKVYERQKI